MECWNCGIDYDELKFSFACPDCKAKLEDQEEDVSDLFEVGGVDEVEEDEADEIYQNEIDEFSPVALRSGLTDEQIRDARRLGTLIVESIPVMPVLGQTGVYEDMQGNLYSHANPIRYRLIEIPEAIQHITNTDASGNILVTGTEPASATVIIERSPFESDPLDLPS